MCKYYDLSVLRALVPHYSVSQQMIQLVVQLNKLFRHWANKSVSCLASQPNKTVSGSAVCQLISRSPNKSVSWLVTQPNMSVSDSAKASQLISHVTNKTVSSFVAQSINILFIQGVGWDWANLLSRPLLHLLYQPRMMTMMRSVEQSVEKKDWQGNPKYSEKIYPCATSSTTNLTSTDLGSNSGRRGGKRETSRLCYGTVSDQ
jgi:hypothetical protein